MVESNVLGDQGKGEEVIMVTNRDDEERTTGRFGTHRVVVIGQIGQAHEPILDTVEETLIDDDVMKTTTVVFRRCTVCGRVMHNEAELGGACGRCGAALCLECSKQRACVRCGRCHCFDCSIVIANSIYCRRHAIEELGGRVFAVLVILGVVCGIAMVIWNVAS